MARDIRIPKLVGDIQSAMSNPFTFINLLNEFGIDEAPEEDQSNTNSLKQ